MKRSLLPLLSFGCLLAGCQEKHDDKLRVGLLDTTRILAEMPKYKDLQSNLTKEQAAFASSLPAPGQQVDKARVEAIQADAERRRTEWQRRVNDVVQEAIKDIRDLTTEVAQDKNLDMVVVDTPTNKGVFYKGAAQDITIDVLLKMKK